MQYLLLICQFCFRYDVLAFSAKVVTASILQSKGASTVWASEGVHNSLPILYSESWTRDKYRREVAIEFHLIHTVTLSDIGIPTCNMLGRYSQRNIFSSALLSVVLEPSCQPEVLQRETDIDSYIAGMQGLVHVYKVRYTGPTIAVTDLLSGLHFSCSIHCDSTA